MTTTGESFGEARKRARIIQRFDNYFDELSRTDVMILVWGPASHSTLREKRDTLVNALNEAGDHNIAFTSEQISLADERFAKWPPKDAEMIHADESDVVICLCVPDREVTGVMGEVLFFAEKKEIRPKLRILRPKESELRGFLGDVALDTINELPHENCYEYADHQLETMHDLVEQCLGWVEQVRMLKHRLLRYQRHGGLPPLN